MDEITEKKKLIKEIKTELEDIEYIRNNYIFDDDLKFCDIKEIELLVGRVWLKYHKLYQMKFCDKIFDKRDRATCL